MEPIRIIPLEACCKEMEHELTYSVRAYESGIRTTEDGTAYLMRDGHSVIWNMRFCPFCGVPLQISGASRKIEKED